MSHTGATALVLPALRGRWEEEAEPLVRAEVLSGISRLDPLAGAVAVATVLDPCQPAGIRMAALFACLDAGLPWTEAHHTTMLSLLPTEPLGGDCLDLERNEPFTAVVEALLNRDRLADREAAFALVDAALRDGRAEVRAEAIWTADRACMLSRGAPRRLLAGLRAAAVDEEAVVAMASLLGRLGTAAAAAADLLAPLAGRNPDQADDHADRAPAALALVAPAQASPFLASGLGRRPRALDAAAGFLRPADSAFPYDGELLGAIRHRLVRLEALSGNEPGLLTNLLGGWGARAASALPELYEALVLFPGQVAPAIAAIALDSAPGERAEAVTVLRAAAGEGSLPAAKAVYDLVGEHEPLVQCLDRVLRSGGRRLREALGTVGALGPRAAVLAPVLREALSGPDGETATPALDADTALAEALWHVTEDVATVVAALDSVFARAEQNSWSQWSAVRATRTTALLGPAGRPLTPRLKTLLDHPVQVPAAVLALTAVAAPASLDRTALASAVLRSAEQEADPTGACDALEALGVAALTADRLHQLSVLADGDARIIRSGVEDRIIRQDEAFRNRARALVTTFTAPGRTDDRNRQGLWIKSIELVPVLQLTARRVSYAAGSSVFGQQPEGLG
ncbi:hypothetical protein [Streptomyces mirabilis]|uniref:hypothetical protein n=1 Tax=Streptomyces mirabilis TaxID=68239 RepID=UPI0036BDFFEB